MSYEKSQDYFNRAHAIAGRSLTRSKAPGRLFDVGAGPLYALYGDGCKIVDVDNHAYIDTICGLGAISLGYGSFSKAVREEIEDGWCYSLPSYYEPLAADAILTHVAPWASSIRFVKTGSEATHAAYRIAKRATGRDDVVVGDWAYHGWHEWSADAARFSWDADLAATYREPQTIAAVFIEPHRWEPIDVAWLQSVRAFCDRIGALLVFDEMIYGGRWALGGATEYFGVVPDLACFGKAIGNGAPIACVVGNAALAEHGELISGTYSGDAAALAAVCSTITVYVDKDLKVIERLWARGTQLRHGLKEVADDAPFGWAFEIDGQPVHQRVRFVNDADGAKGRTFAAQMAKRGVLWHPQVTNVMFAHSEDDIEAVIAAAHASLNELRDAR